VKTVLVLDDDLDLCFVLRETFTMLGANSIEFQSYADLVTHRNAVLEANIALLDVNLGKGVPSGIDAYNWLVQQKFKGRLIFFSGHAQSDPLIREALKLPNVTFLAKPASIEKLEELVAP
jgi:FixJ family two-component response regulator